MRRQGRVDPYHDRLKPTSVRTVRRSNRHPGWRMLVLVVVAIVCILVLPKLNIGGHHVRFWLLP
jgi:hypothetical protein